MSRTSLKALTVHYREGERIAGAGERGGCMFVVQSGRVRLSRPAGEGETRVEIARLEKGDFFGENAILEGGSYRADADADTACDIVEIAAPTFQQMLQANPEIAVRLLRKLSARLDTLEARLSEADHGTSETGPEPEPVEAAAGAAAVASGPATGADEAAEITPDAAQPAEEPASADAAPRKGPRLESEDGEVVFVLEGDDVLVGRYDPVTELQPLVDLSTLDTKRSVSRRHARLQRRKKIWYLSEEVGALNGTFVNGVKLLAGRGAPISDGDTISFGMVRLTYKEGS